MRPILLLSGFLSTGEPSVKLSALVVFSVASFDRLRLEGSSTMSLYLGDLFEPEAEAEEESENTDSISGVIGSPASGIS